MSQPMLFCMCKVYYTTLVDTVDTGFLSPTIQKTSRKKNSLHLLLSVLTLTRRLGVS